MKQTVLSISFAVFLFMTVGSAPAQALVQDGLGKYGWDRPIRKARLDVSEGKSIFSRAKDVTLIMTKQDGQTDPSGLVLLIDDQVVHFDIVKSKYVDCGSMAYAATEIREDGHVGLTPLQLVLIDHSSQRNCMRAGTYKWEALATSGGDYVLRSGGYPEQVMTIQ